MLNRLRDQQLTRVQQVILVTGIRKAISGSDEPPTEDLIRNTDAVQILSSILI